MFNSHDGADEERTSVRESRYNALIGKRASQRITVLFLSFVLKNSNATGQSPQCLRGVVIVELARAAPASCGASARLLS